MNTLKVKSSFPKAVEALGDAELGRLFRGMMRYAFSGTAPELPGAERIVWPTVKADIDGQGVAYEARCKSVENARGFILDRNQSENSLISDRKQSDFSLQRQEEDKGEKGKEKSSPSHSPVKEKSLKEGTEEEKKIECVKKTTRARKAFVPPTLDEVRAYCQQRGNNVDPVQFWEYFNEGGWVDAKGQPVLAWKQKLLTWERFNGGRPNRPLKPNEIHGSAGRGPIDRSDLDELLRKIEEKI
jgi:hypothetical protein